VEPVTRRRLLGVLLAAALAVAGGAGFASAFAAGDLVRPVAVGAAAGAGGSVLVSGLLRRRLVLSALATLALVVPAGLVATGGGPADLVDGLRDGARVVLTSAVPMAPTPAALTVPFVVTAMAAFAGAEAALRARNPVAPAIPSLVALAAGLAFGQEGTRPSASVVTAWVVTTSALVALRRPDVGAGRAAAGEAGAGGRQAFGGGVHGRAGSGPGGAAGPDDGGRSGHGGRGRPAGRGGLGGAAVAGQLARRGIGLVVVVGVVAVVAPRVGDRLPGAGARERFSLRDLVEQPATPEGAANPLVLMTAWQDGPDEPLFTAESSGPVDRWRLAVLDSYDGAEWYSGADFVPVGRRLPDPPDGGGTGDGDGGSGGDTGGGGGDEGRELDLTVRDLAVEGPWLPVADRPVEVGADDLLFDIGGGTLLARDGRAPTRYDAASVATAPAAPDLRSASAAGDDQARGMRRLPGNVPEELRLVAEEATAGATSDYMRAAAIERFLARSSDATPFQLATEALPSGHSVGHLRCFLLSPERCGRRGSTEQFVAAFAVLARASGLPTRVVVGFTGGPGGAADQVMSHEATAWPEVRFAGVGWVPFDPVPDPDVTTTPMPADVAGGGGTPDNPTATTLGGRADDADLPGEGAVEPREADGGTPVAAYAGVAALVVAVLGLPAAVRWLRRRRRKGAPAPGDRVAGAWAEAADGLVLSGVAVTAEGAVTDTVVAARARLRGVAEPLAPLGDLVNRSRFGPGAVSDTDAHAAWHLSDAFTRARRRSRTPGQRAREYVSLRAPARGRS
jgi:hypothetical protein